MSLLKFFNFLPVPSPVRPDTHRERNAGISQRRWPGTLQGGHHGSEGQGK
ncbi:unnamed protein product [Staurois parvus]|uniref:Uncharacterized protein n=1 Tax=Staurois parvus TaxID=386267 RepID=A0ABN9BJL1_9NEOB|nr:unnamed protein product [Staurois parvus]